MIVKGFVYTSLEHIENYEIFIHIFKPNCAKIFSHLIHAGEGGSYRIPTLSPSIEGQTKKQMIKL